MCSAPKAAMTRNQRRVIGPKKVATRPVPRLCTANSAIRMPSAIGRTYCSKAGVTSFRPSTAESTEMAGVIAASP